MRLFVTGHLGKIGRDLAPLFADHEVTGFDIEDEFHHDTRDITMIRDAMPLEVDLVIHMANIPHPMINRPVIDYSTINVDGCRNLLTVAKKRARGFVFLSSLAAIGFDAPLSGKTFTVADEWPKGEPPWNEERGVPLPMDAWDIEPYGTSKVHQEKMIAESDMSHIILRCGPYGNLSPEHIAKRTKVFQDALSYGFLYQTMRRILHDKRIEKSQTFHVCPVGMWGGEKLQEYLTA